MCLSNYKVLLNFRPASCSVHPSWEWGQKLFNHLIVIQKIEKFVSKFENIYLPVFSSAGLSRVPKWFLMDAENLIYVESLCKKNLQNTLGLSEFFWFLIFWTVTLCLDFYWMLVFLLNIKSIISECNDLLVTGPYLEDFNLSPCLSSS